MTSIPSSHRALVTKSDKSGWEVKEQALPEYDDLLVKVHAVALNPTDWKHLPVIIPGGSTGSDFAGVVVDAAGEFKVGDRVAGFTRGGCLSPDNGAFAEYVGAQEPIVWRIPENISFEEAAAIGGIPADTAAQALYTRLKIPCPWPSSDIIPSSVSKGDPILIWSGAASVSYYAIQLARIAGLEVYTTASPQHHDTLKKLGAVGVFDYDDPEVSKKIKEASGGKIRIALDGISTQKSTKAAIDALSDQGGHIVTVWPYHGETRPGVGIQYTLVYSVLEPTNEVDRGDIAEWHKVLPELLKPGGGLVPHTVDFREGGLDKIPEGLQELKENKVRGKRLVYKI